MDLGGDQLWHSNGSVRWIISRSEHMHMDLESN